MSRILRVKFFSLLPAVCLFLSLPVWAADQSLGEVEVRARGYNDAQDLETSRYDSAAFTSVLTSDDFKGRRTGLAEALEELSGVQIRRRGGLDDFATVSIRGSTSEQVAVYIDGVLQNQGEGGAVNVATIPTDQIERVEVYKGMAPARFGSSNIGGVVNIVTKKAGKNRSLRLIESFGSFRTVETTVLSGGRHLFHRKLTDPSPLEPSSGAISSETSYQVGYTYGRSAGDFSFKNNNGTPFNAGDDRVEKRRNNEFARHNLFTGLEWRKNGFSVDFRNQFFREDRGIPGLATLTSDFANLSTTRNAVSFELKKTDMWKGLNLSLLPHFQYQKQQFSDPEGEIGLGTQDNDNDTFQYGATFFSELPLGSSQRLSAILDYRGERFLPEDFSRTPASQPHSSRDTFSLGIEDEIYFLEEKIIVNPSIRTEHVFDRQGGAEPARHHPFSGKIGVKYQPSGPEGILTFKTNFSRSFRIPSFSELFGDRGTFIGNPGLLPEKGLNWDMGLIVRAKPIRFEISYYLNHVSDLIQLLQTSQFTVQARNLSKARIQGVETAGSTVLWDHIDLSANYTFQWAKDASGLPGLDGKFLPGRPRHEASAKAAVFNNWGRLFTDLSFQDRNFLDTQNVLRVDHRLLWGTGVSFSPWKKLTASVEAKNLLNDRVSDLVGFPLPGRSFYGKLDFALK